MHDLDRTIGESGYDTDREYDLEDEYANDGEFDYEDEYDYETDYEADDGEVNDESDYELDYEYDMESASPFSEEVESEMAFELLSVNNEQQLDEFIGKWIRKAGRFLKRRLPSVGRFLKKGLKGVVKLALPIAGKIAGGVYGGPAGSMLGSKLGSMASNVFEIELEGLSPEDQEFEVAKRVIRYGNQSIRNAAKLIQKMPPEEAAKLALKQAASTHAPGMLKPRGATRPLEGKWKRIGNKIVLYGLYRKRRPRV